MSALTCQFDLSSGDEPDICGLPARWMQPNDFGDFPACDQCATEDAYAIEDGTRIDGSGQ